MGEGEGSSERRRGEAAEGTCFSWKRPDDPLPSVSSPVFDSPFLALAISSRMRSFEWPNSRKMTARKRLVMKKPPMSTSSTKYTHTYGEKAPSSAYIGVAQSSKVIVSISAIAASATESNVSVPKLGFDSK